MAEPGTTTAPAAMQAEIAPRGTSAALNVALVNAMGDAALAITEQRFSRLLHAVFPDRPIVLSCSTLRAIARGEMAAARIARHYTSIETWHEAPPDLVIFTGAEPQTEDLRDEPFWPELTALFDQTAASRTPVLFSCLAAHAAALHFSGIARQPAARKIFGVFAQSLAAAHPLTEAAPQDFAVAHSRWNSLREADLHRGGFAILSRGERCGADAFVPEHDLPQLYWQGHPEYEETALDGEFRRDQRRFEAGLIPSRPDAPDLAAALPGALPAARQFCSVVLRRFVQRSCQARA